MAKEKEEGGGRGGKCCELLSVWPGGLSETRRYLDAREN